MKPPKYKFISSRGKPFIIKAQEIIDGAANFLAGTDRNCSPELQFEGEKIHVWERVQAASSQENAVSLLALADILCYWMKGYLLHSEDDSPQLLPTPITYPALTDPQ